MHSTLVKVKRALTGKGSPRKGGSGDDGTASIDSGTPSKRTGYGSDAETTPNTTPTTSPTKRKGLSARLHRKGHHDADHHGSPTPPTPGTPASGAVAAPEQPLGTLLRGPINRDSSATPGTTSAAQGGMVFGRPLEDCVRDTKADMNAMTDGADGTTLASTRPVADSGLDARLIPALVLRCVQYLYKYGVKEEGLFRVSGRMTQTTTLRNQFDTGADYDLLSCSPDVLNPHSVSSLLKAYLRELPDPVLTRALGPLFNSALAASATEGEEAKPKEEGEQTEPVAVAAPAPVATEGEEPATTDDDTPKAEVAAQLGEGEVPTVTVTQPDAAESEAKEVKEEEPVIPDGASYTPPTIAESVKHPPELVQPLSDLVSQLPQENKDLLLTLLDLLAETASHADENKMNLPNLFLVFCPTLGMSPVLLNTLIEHRQAIWDSWMPELSVVGEDHEGEIEADDEVQAGAVEGEVQVEIHERVDPEPVKVDVTPLPGLLGVGAEVEAGEPHEDELNVEAGAGGAGKGYDYDGIVPPAARPRGPNTGLMMPPTSAPRSRSPARVVTVDSTSSHSTTSSDSLASKQDEGLGEEPGLVLPGVNDHDVEGGLTRGGDGVDVIPSPSKQGLDSPPLSAGLAKAFDARYTTTTDTQAAAFIDGIGSDPSPFAAGLAKAFINGVNAGSNPPSPTKPHPTSTTTTSLTSSTTASLPSSYTHPLSHVARGDARYNVGSGDVADSAQDHDRRVVDGGAGYDGSVVPAHTGAGETAASDVGAGGEGEEATKGRLGQFGDVVISPVPASARRSLPLVPPSASSTRPITTSDLLADEPTSLGSNPMAASTFIQVPLPKSNSSTSLSKMSRSAISQFEETTGVDGGSVAACLVPLPDGDAEEDYEEPGVGDQGPWVILPPKPATMELKDEVLPPPPSEPLAASMKDSTLLPNPLSSSTSTLKAPTASSADDTNLLLPASPLSTKSLPTRTPKLSTASSSAVKPRPTPSNSQGAGTLLLAFQCIVALTIVVGLSGMYQMYLPRYVRPPTSPASAIFVFGRGGL